jgi:hypothetical protein
MKDEVEFVLGSGDEGQGFPVSILSEPMLCGNCKTVKAIFINRFGRTLCACCDAEKYPDRKGVAA